MAEGRGPSWQDVAQVVVGLLMALMLWWQSGISSDVKELTKGMAQLQERTIKMDEQITAINGRMDSFARRESVKDLSERVDRLHQ